MARKSRTLLPRVTEADTEQRPQDVRRTAHGWAWTCAYCGQFASSQALSGKYVCRSHGGVTARQRSPEAQADARRKRHPVPRPPGRPIQSGYYSRRPNVRVDDLVAQYRELKLDLDCTDEDMLYLRAYLQEWKEQRPSLVGLAQPVQRLQQLLESCEADSPQDALAWATQHPEAAASMREARLLLCQLKVAFARIEDGHARLIKLSKVRAETRLKNQAAQQVGIFVMLLDRFALILEEQLSPEDLAAFQKRIAKELSEVPGGLVESKLS
jgi:hypothetical protein